MFLGSLIGGIVSDKIGRKSSLIVVSLIGIVGTGLQCVAPIISALIAFRFFLGLAVGLVSVVSPKTVMEMSPPNIRGFLGTLFQLSLTFGIFLSYVAGYFLSSLDPEYSWKIMFLIGIVPCVLILIVAIIMPESPVWIEMKQQQPKNVSSSTSTTKNYLKPKNMKFLIIGLVLACVLQLTGINAVMYYAPAIFSKVNLGPKGPLLATMLTGFWNFLTTIVAVLLVERLGRRLLYLIGLAALTLSNLALAFNFQFAPENLVGYISIGFLLVYILGFEVGPGGLFWVLINEMFPQEIAGGAVIMNAVQWFFTLVISVAFLPLTQATSQATVFFIFAGVGVLTFVFMVIFLPETRAGKNKKMKVTEEEETPDEEKQNLFQQQREEEQHQEQN